MSKRKPSEDKKKKYSNYALNGTEAKNRLAKLVRHVKRFPHDTQALLALDEFKAKGIPHRRHRRGTGQKLTKEMHELLKVRGNRMSHTQIKTLAILNNPGKHITGCADYSTPTRDTMRYKRVTIGSAQ